MAGKKTGFIVHPFETSDNKYSASYGNHNKTSRSFTTLKQAKSYLKRKGIYKAIYDSPSGVKLINIGKTTKTRGNQKRRRRRRNPYGIDFGINLWKW